MPIEHDLEAHRFFVHLPTGTALLAYAPVGDDRLEFYSTYVPPNVRGQGIGGRLVEAGLAYARREGCRVIPTCWFVAQWIEDHPGWADLLAA